MYAPTRDQAREFLFATWRKYRAGEALAGLERVALEVVLAHPEYQGMLEDPERHAHRDYLPADGRINPFLHMNLHLAIEEQLSIDQPPGIRAEFETIRTRLGDEHAAKHVLLECLGETLWLAQRNGSAPDARHYLECVRTTR